MWEVPGPYFDPVYIKLQDISSANYLFHDLCILEPCTMAIPTDKKILSFLPTWDTERESGLEAAI
jgi:hypothetical protein